MVTPGAAFVAREKEGKGGRGGRRRGKKFFFSSVPSHLSNVKKRGEGGRKFSHILCVAGEKKNKGCLLLPHQSFSPSSPPSSAKVHPSSIPLSWCLLLLLLQFPPPMGGTEAKKGGMGGEGLLARLNFHLEWVLLTFMGMKAFFLLLLLLFLLLLHHPSSSCSLILPSSFSFSCSDAPPTRPFLFSFLLPPPPLDLSSLDVMERKRLQDEDAFNAKEKTVYLNSGSQPVVCQGASGGMPKCRSLLWREISTTY